MRIPSKKSAHGRDDHLFGLLLPYKSYNTYFRVLVSESEHRVSIQMADNPGKWKLIEKERYEGFRQLRRLELGVPKLSVKYLLPGHLLRIMGPMLDMKIPPDKVFITDRLDEEGYYSIDIPVKFYQEVEQEIKKLIALSPEKKYEILEKCVAESQENQE